MFHQKSARRALLLYRWEPKDANVVQSLYMMLAPFLFSRGEIVNALLVLNRWMMYDVLNAGNNSDSLKCLITRTRIHKRIFLVYAVKICIFIPLPNKVWRGYINVGVSVRSGEKTVGSLQNLVSGTTSTIFIQFKWKLAHITALKYRCERYVLLSCQTKLCHGNHILFQNACGWNYFTIFMHFKWKLVHVMTLNCRCARHVFWVCRTMCCHGNHMFANTLCIIHKYWIWGNLLIFRWRKLCVCVCVCVFIEWFYGGVIHACMCVV